MKTPTLFVTSAGRHRAWFVYAPLLVALIAGLILFVDKPFAAMMHEYDRTHPHLIAPFKIFTEFGDSIYYLVPSGVAAILLAVIGWRARRTAAQFKYYLYALHAAYIFGAVALSGILVDVLKIIFGRGRPVLLQQEEFYGFDPFNAASRYASFPSGHANTAFALALSLGVLLPRWRVPLLIYACLVAATRPLVAAHYLSDIVGGAVVAFLTTLFVTALYMKAKEKLERRYAARTNMG